MSIPTGPKFALLGEGISLICNDEDNRIVRSYRVAVDDDDDWFGRIVEYVEQDYNVSLWSLLKALLYPRQTHFALCTSFVSYAVFGKIDKTCNSLVEFEKYVSEHNAV